MQTEVPQNAAGSSSSQRPEGVGSITDPTRRMQSEFHRTKLGVKLEGRSCFTHRAVVARACYLAESQWASLESPVPGTANLSSARWKDLEPHLGAHLAVLMPTPFAR